MGLPFFVAPVESDLPANKPRKSSSTTTEPSRSIIRRIPRTSREERRSRNVRIEDVINSQQERIERLRRIHNNAAATSAATAAHSRSDMEAMGLFTARRAGFRVHHVTRDPATGRSVASTSTATYPDSMGIRDIAERERERLARRNPNNPAWLEPEISNSDLERRPLRDALREITTTTDPQRRWELERRVTDIFEAVPSYSRGDSDTLGSHEEQIRDLSPLRRFRRPFPDHLLDASQRRALGAEETTTSQGAFTESGNSATPRRSNRLDGLGDRQRSISPEGWDTLFTTITPDPQPPSANSSFASNSWANSSLSALASRYDVISGGDPDSREVDPADLCDYVLGPENSDGEIDYSRSIPMPTAPRQVRSNVTRLVYPAPREERHTPPNPSRQQDDPDRTPRQTSPPAGSRRGDTASDEDWMGMTHIVRNLVERRDIPDEWWAEVGLSRILRTNQEN